MARSNRSDPDKPGFKLEDYPFYLMTRTMGVYYATLAEALKTIGLDQPRWRALMILGEDNPSSVGDIARKSVIKLPTMTRVIQRMQQEGLVKTRRRENDNRVTEVSLTAEGEAALARVRTVASRVFRRATEGVGSAELRGFTETLRRLRANLERSPYED